MSRKSKCILRSLIAATVGAACGAAVYFIRKGKSDLEKDFDDFKDEFEEDFEEEESTPVERTYTTLPKPKSAEDAAPDPEPATCDEASEKAAAETENDTTAPESKDNTKDGSADCCENACNVPEPESCDVETDFCREEAADAAK